MFAAFVRHNGTVELLCTCEGGDHETCPMHHNIPNDNPEALLFHLRRWLWSHDT